VPIYLIPSLTSITNRSVRKADTYMVKLNTDGFDRFRRNMQELAAMKTIPVADFLTDDFVRTNTDFKTTQQMLDASGIKSADAEVTPALDQFVVEHSGGKFSGWRDMTHTAFGEYAKRKLAS
jgi:hypothetical protein